MRAPRHTIGPWPATASGIRATMAMVAAVVLLSMTTGAVTSIPAAAAPGKPVVYFTFDDGPHSHVTNRLLDTLDRYGAKATFFVVGTRVNSYPTTTRRIVAEGHAIANHTNTHPKLTNLSDASVFSQFMPANAAITQVTGVVPTCYRPPYGAVDSRVHSLAVAAGLPNAQWTAGYSNTHWGLWDIDTRDWQLGYSRTWYELSKVSAGNVVLMHSLKSFSADMFARWMTQNADRFDFQPLPGCGARPISPTPQPPPAPTPTPIPTPTPTPT
ncbi:MAG: polysaccharide deacetylase family protein, partial [Acidimicrobiia bacterium]|nr:polysaccharide deacetylase family protein [Acidimicrobiia bacterium]